MSHVPGCLVKNSSKPVIPSYDEIEAVEAVGDLEYYVGVDAVCITTDSLESWETILVDSVFQICYEKRLSVDVTGVR